MEVARITTKDGRKFFTDSFGPDVMREIMKRCEWERIERIDMLAKDYKELPATQESAELFRK